MREHTPASHFSSPSLGSRLLAWMPFVLSAAAVALVIELSISRPLAGAVLGAFAAALAISELRVRRRVRRLLASGDIHAVLGVWEAALSRLPNRETMGPLFIATAFAANGMTERARRALARSVRGQAWDSAVEQRLFVETLLDAFEGERQRALERAEEIHCLPLPTASPFLRARVLLLRHALVALARAFARTSTPDDARLLERAAHKSPLVHWAMRYAAAIAHIDHREPERARALIASAPRWPEESAFHFFHEEIVAELSAPASA